jgi:4-hydroxy-tetrahydrodipicolinate synthase
VLLPGVYPASITPFTPEGKVDHLIMARLLAGYEAAGCKGVVLAGTNGEGPSLSAVEKRDLVRTMVPVRGKLQLIAGVASPSLDEAIWLCQQAAKDGAVAALVMAPGYFREASPEGIAKWFERLLDDARLPVLAYNFPQRTGITLTPDLFARLADHPNLAGLKDSSGERGNLPAYRTALKEHHVLYVGNETLLLEALANGWTGTISGAANVVAEWLCQVMATSGQAQQTKFDLLLPVLEAIRKSPQPATHKAILHANGLLPCPDLRLPLEAASSEVVTPVRTALSTLGL